MMAMVVSVISLVGLFAATGQAIRIVRSGKEIASASQMLQQRIETFRYTPPWTNITSTAGIRTVMAAETATAPTFGNATETVSVTPYPVSGTPLVVTRNPAGTITSTGQDLTAQTCVKFTVTTTWTGVGNIQRTRQVSTIIAKGGI